MNVGCTSLSSVVASNSLSCSSPTPSRRNTSTSNGAQRGAAAYRGFAQIGRAILGLYLRDRLGHRQAVERLREVDRRRPGT